MPLEVIMQDGIAYRLNAFLILRFGSVAGPDELTAEDRAFLQVMDALGASFGLARDEHGFYVHLLQDPKGQNATLQGRS